MTATALEECVSCGVEHASNEEAEAIHSASRSVRDWLRREILFKIQPWSYKKPMKPNPNISKFRPRLANGLR